MNKIFAILLLIILIGCNQKAGSAGQGHPANVHYYDNGHLQDSIHVLTDEEQRQFLFYETGELKEVGYLVYGSKAGVWRTYDKKGLITNLQYFDSGRVVNMPLDTSDFYFSECTVDSFFSILLPSKWQISVRPGYDRGVSKFWQPDSGYSAAIQIRKVDPADIQGNTQAEITQYIEGITAAQFKGHYFNILYVRWEKPNMLSIFYIVEGYGKLIGIDDIYYLASDNGKKWYYHINCSAFDGHNSGFNKYLDVFDEAQYSIKWKGKNVF